MSITLMAYPMAFLINPEEAKNEKLKRASDDKVVNEEVATENLRAIRVLTNIKLEELNGIMSMIDCQKHDSYTYSFQNGLRVHWVPNGKYCSAVLSGGKNAKFLQQNGEDFFKQLDEYAMRNVRLIESNEFFYYTYGTAYQNMRDIYAKLKDQGAKHIYSTEDDEVVAEIEGQNVKYFKPQNESNYILEVEQKVTIMNIRMSGDFEGTNVRYGYLSNLKIQTNIKQEELKTLLRKANYLYYSGNSSTPLKNSDATLNWVYKNGFYVAEFSGTNNAAINKEAEIIFRKLNIAAGRDLRLINDQSTIVYTYNTNYTDKGILLNTLTEHGATELVENGDEISCKLFGMEMVYYKKDTTGGYVLDITQVSNKGECEDVINDLNEEYCLNIQEMTYNKIKERLEQENMRLESESIMDDNSIVLTIDI